MSATDTVKRVSTIYPPQADGYQRSDRQLIDEVQVVRELLLPKYPKGTFVDVGANLGQTTLPFARAGWRTLSFEPDPANFARLRRATAGLSLATIEQVAVGNECRENVSFFTSPKGSGISSLSAFTPTHRETATVQLITLSDYCARNAIDAVTVLKVDVEGHDLRVLEGFDWERLHPEAIVCEYEDKKTVANGYCLADLAAFLEAHGYAVYVSEWHPIVRYGLQHEWRRLVTWPSNSVLDSSWGNLLAFATPIDPSVLQRATQTCVRRAAHPYVQQLRALAGQTLQALRLR